MLRNKGGGLGWGVGRGRSTIKKRWDRSLLSLGARNSEDTIFNIEYYNRRQSVEVTFGR